ncbi:glycoside hydrolase family 2 protein [Sphingomonas sp. TREG-RG-20F-R18-01]|uniref:beta-mannosidase n=1 Tax=Sphingomonas sp. TREG-RG-20F-R18-01 TaxID=2914982 RepID=UPI001F571DE8|nr:glycoside hydrolase family 2 protein [Sphingomonas sp. TREG-RG-20F-R18-01]
MRRSLRTALLMALLTGIAAPAVAAPRSAISLDDGWQARIAPSDGTAVAAHRSEARWFPAKVPGSIQQDLIARHRVPDPFLSTNEAAIQWVGRTDWQYRRTLQVTPALLARDHLDLVFDGLDTFATVTINGQTALSAANAHRRFRIDAKRFLKAGANEILITFAAPIRTLQPMVMAQQQSLPGEYDSAFGDEPKGRQTSPYIRKPKYHYGWDWGPRILNVGPWRPVRLEAWDSARINTLRVEQDALSDAEARLSAKATIQADRPGIAQVRVTLTAPDGARQDVVQQITLAAGANAVSLPITVARPERWQPVGYGTQPLYRVTAALTQDGTATDTAERRIGLRTVELIRGGGAMGFRVNGIPIFAKGANVIPFDSFPTRVTPASMRPLLTAARDANMNMLRVWGGGYYLDDAFYDMADEMGLMVWQDFMFGGSVTPPDAAFRETVRIEAEEQVERIGNHPSIVLWSGGNEILAGWENWGDRKAFKKAVGADEQERIGAGMAVLFDRVLRDAVLTRAPGTPYWPGSPSTDYDGPVDTDAAGDRHFWDVWSGSKPVERYLDSCPRFMSEYGFQAMPDMATVRAFAGKGPLKPDSVVLKAHQKFLAGEGNDRLLLYMRDRLGEPRDIADFVYLSQVNQAEAIALAALHHRSCRPVTMGSLFWQVNDVWPSISWSSIDHDGRWKLLQFAARRFFAPQVIVAEHTESTTRIALVSDATTPTPARWRVRAFDMAGKPLAEQGAAATMPALSATDVAKLDDATLFAGADPATSYAMAELLVGDAVVSRAMIERGVPKTMHYPDPGLSATWDGNRVTVRATALARAVMLDFGDVGAHPSDDGFDLLPGESRTISVTSKASPKALAAALTLRSLGSRR